jgi:hypothetical protein
MYFKIEGTHLPYLHSIPVTRKKYSQI